MDDVQLNIQLKLLSDILNKKFSILQEILSITENQGVILKSMPNEKEMFFSMFNEKQIRIDNINSGDEIFNRMFGTLMEKIKAEKTSYKTYIAEMQKCVKTIMDIEIKIKLQERNNNKYMQNIINVVPMNIVAKQYAHQKNQKIKDAINHNYNKTNN